MFVFVLNEVFMLTTYFKLRCILICYIDERYRRVSPTCNCFFCFILINYQSVEYTKTQLIVRYIFSERLNKSIVQFRVASFLLHVQYFQLPCP